MLFSRHCTHFRNEIAVGSVLNDDSLQLISVELVEDGFKHEVSHGEPGAVRRAVEKRLKKTKGTMSEEKRAMEAKEVKPKSIRTFEIL